MACVCILPVYERSFQRRNDFDLAHSLHAIGQACLKQAHTLNVLEQQTHAVLCLSFFGFPSVRCIPNETKPSNASESNTTAATDEKRIFLSSLAAVPLIQPVYGASRTHTSEQRQQQRKNRYILWTAATDDQHTLLSSFVNAYHCCDVDFHLPRATVSVHFCTDFIGVCMLSTFLTLISILKIYMQSKREREYRIQRQ